MKSTIQARVIISPAYQIDFKSLDIRVEIPSDTKPEQYMIIAFNQAKGFINRKVMNHGFRLQVTIPRSSEKEKRKTLYEVSFRNRKTDTMAPSLFVETEYTTNPDSFYNRVLEESRKLSRLANFPDVWEMIISPSPRLYHRGKYYLPEEFPYKFNKVVNVDPPTNQVRLVDEFGQYPGKVTPIIVVDGTTVAITEEPETRFGNRSRIS